MVNNYYSNQERILFNPIRITQWVLCGICLVSAIMLLLKNAETVGLFVLLPSISFFVITFIDVIVTSLLKPMLWTTWIAFAFVAFLMFWLCVGLLIPALYDTLPGSILILYCIITIYALTGLIFLMDILNILTWLKEKKPPLFENESCITSECSNTFSTPQTSYTIPPEVLTSDVSTSPPSQKSAPVMQKLGCGRENCGKRMFTSSGTPSHGGTFHVSRDVAPILNPSASSNHHYYQTAQNSNSLDPNNRLQTCNECLPRDDAIEVVSKKSRTVSTSVRTVPKQMNPEFEVCKYQNEAENFNGAKKGHEIHDRTVQHYYNCRCITCGIVHSHVATVAPIVPKCNCCNCLDHKQLPALQECGDEYALENYTAVNKEYKLNKKNMTSTHVFLAPYAKSNNSVEEIYTNNPDIHRMHSLSSSKKRRNEIHRNQQTEETSTSDVSIDNYENDVVIKSSTVCFELGDNKNIYSRTYQVTPNVRKKMSDFKPSHYCNLDEKTLSCGTNTKYNKTESDYENLPPRCDSININNLTSETFQYVPREMCRCAFLKELQNPGVILKPPSRCQIL